MESNITKSMTMKIFQKGQVVIPAELRTKYQIEVGDLIDVVSTDNGILLKPKPKKRNKETLTQKLFGVFTSYSRQKHKLTDTDIKKATEDGFIEGWDE